MTGRVEWLHRTVVRPTLEFMADAADRPWIASESAQVILLGTAAVESNFAHIRQIGRGNSQGPARGFFQVEPQTAVDVIERYASRSGYKDAIKQFIPPGVAVSVNGLDFKDALQHNPALGCMIARLKYADDPRPLPDWHDVAGQAAIWKSHYNASPIGLHANEYNRVFAHHNILTYAERTFGGVAI